MNKTEERTRPAIWGPVLLAAVFLAVIGASAGWVLGVRDGGGRGTSAETTGRPYDTGAHVPDGGGPAQEPGGAPGASDDTTGPAGKPRADRCPAHTVELASRNGASGELTLKLYLYTGKSEVWICVDADHRLFYQGHVLGRGDDLIEGHNALFLTDVVYESGRYLATNRNGDHATRYRVSEHELVIEDSNGTQREPAVAAHG